MLPKKKIYIRFIGLILIVCICLTLVIRIYTKNQAINRLVDLEKNAQNIKINNGIGTTYYVSSNGTSNSGTDINNPMSLETANSKTYYANDKVLFKRGDIFYGSVSFNVNADDENLFYIGNYGDENLEKPIITTSFYVLDEDAWSEDGNGIYKIDLSSNYIKGYHSESSDYFDVGFFRDYNNNIYGNKKNSKEKLVNEWDFYCEDENLYVKSSQNPIIKLGKITFASEIAVMFVSSNSVIDGLIISDTGNHGIRKKTTITENLFIANCVIQNIGGSYQKGDTRYGNGIEFWNQANNTIVQNCVFKNIYDAAYTLQGNTVTDGFYNNVCKNNIFINCTYSIEIFCHNNYNIKKYKFKKNIIKNNIIINQGQGFGYSSRLDKTQPANLVSWTIPKSYENKNTFKYNKSYNSRALYYKDSTVDKDIFKSSVDSDYNMYYLNYETIFFIDSSFHTDRNILDEYDFDQNSSFNYLTDEEIEIISDPDILNSNDYNEIKEYYDNFDKKYNSKKATKSLIDSIDAVMNSEKCKELLNNNSINNSYLSLRNAINNLSESIDLITKDSVSYSYECLYDLMETVSNEYYSNNLSEDVDETYLRDFIKDLDSLSSGYKEIYSYFVTEDNIDVSTIKNILNNAIEKYNNNLDLNIGYLEDIISTAKKIYNNYLTTDNVYENLFNKERITYITDVVNNILDIQINKAVESEKSKIKVEFDKDTTQPTSENITATITIGDETKINNNNGSNKYTFYENGTFTFDLEIRGVKFTLGVTINNISKNYKIEDGYITNITKNTLASTLKNELNISNYSIIRNGQEINLNTNVVSTGDILTYNDKSYTLIVNGDINKDGNCGIHDLVSFRKYLLKYITYDDIESMAADTNQDKELDIKDLVGIRKIILN